MQTLDSLVLRLHPDDPTLLEVLLSEGGVEHRVARAPVSDPRTWEWTTPPSWLRSAHVEALLDEVEGSAVLRAVPLRAFDDGGMVVAEVPVAPPRASVRAIRKGQARALARLGLVGDGTTVDATGRIVEGAA